MNNSYKTALGGIVSAICLVLMLLTGIVPIGTYAFPALAGLILIIIVIEVNCKWAFAVFFVVSVLSFLLAGDKEAALYFTAFFGFYPIIKSQLEKITNRILEWFLKLLIFNICIITAFFIGMLVLSVPKDSFEIGGVYLPWLFLAVGNIVFIIYDIGLTQVVTKYIRYGHGALMKVFKRN